MADSQSPPASPAPSAPEKKPEPRPITPEQWAQIEKFRQELGPSLVETLRKATE